MGIMLGSGAAAAKPGPAYIARGFHSISSSVSSMSLLLVLLLSPSSSSGSANGGQRFLCTSQRSADVARLSGHLLLLLLDREDVPEDDDEEAAGLAAFLCASHLSTESARPGLGGGDVALLWEDPRPAQLLTLSAERGLDEAEVADLVLRASHLSSESARLGLASGFGRMAARHGVGSCGTIFHLGGVGRSAGRAACATLRCTRATGMAMVDGRRRTETTRAQSQQKRRQVRGDGAERQRWDETVG
jgi:hypothetical protein